MFTHESGHSGTTRELKIKGDHVETTVLDVYSHQFPLHLCIFTIKGVYDKVGMQSFFHYDI